MISPLLEDRYDFLASIVLSVAFTIGFDLFMSWPCAYKPASP